MGALTELKVVLWKSVIIRKRYWFQTFLEILIPIVLFFLLSFGRSKIDGIAKKEIVDSTYTETKVLFDPSQIYYNNIDISDTFLLYAPSTNFTDQIIRNVQMKLGLYNHAIKGLSSQEEVFKKYKTIQENHIVGVIFKEDDTKHFDYELRYLDKLKDFGTNEKFVEIYHYEPEQGSQQYIHGIFLTLQATLNLAFMEHLNNDKALPFTLNFQEFPYPPHKDDSGLTELFMPFLPHITIFSFIFLGPALLTRIVEEKASGTRELLKMVGLKSWMLWFGWFLHAFIPYLVSVVIITIFMKARVFGTPFPPIEFCDAGIFFVFLVLYTISSISFCFFFSTLFNKSLFAMTFGISAWLLTFIIPKTLVASYNLSRGLKLLLALFPNMCLNYGYSAITVYETREIGVQWDNLFKSGSGSKNDITMGAVFLMFILSSLIYFALTFYITYVKPGPYGIPKPWFFWIHSVRKFIRRRIGSSVQAESERPLQEDITMSLKELSIPSKNMGIRCIRLKKSYGPTAVVNDLSMNIPKNSITVLLGHNGAGKTTTMSMITGMIHATSGRVEILGQDIQKFENEVKKKLGLCPQDNLMFHDLTVLEHLLFIATLRNVPSHKVSEVSMDLLEKLQLQDKKNEMARSLSGGMKRKLCLAMALIGDPEVLILDEPTAGMDPESQRFVWNILLEYRQKTEKTILISTHYMDEAEALADYIAIMSDGKKVCHGTPLELKKKFDTGYHLSLMLDTAEKSDEILQLIKRLVPQSQPNSGYYSKVIDCILPIDNKNKFPELLKLLENRKADYKITDISINITTLEDVFLRSGEEQKKLKDKEKTENDSSAIIVDSSTNLTEFNHRPGQCGRRNIWNGLIYKRWYFFSRKKHLYLFAMLFALIVTNLSIYLGQSVPVDFDSGSGINLNLGFYGQSTSIYSSSEEPNSKETERISQIKAYYKREIQVQSGTPLALPSTVEGIIEKGKDNIAFYKSQLIVAAEFNATRDGINANAMYSPYAVHGAPIAVNLVMNAVCKALIGPECAISTHNRPFPKIDGNSYDKEQSEVEVGLLFLSLFPIGLLALAGIYIVFPNSELSTKFVHLQKMCGVSPFDYWLSNYIVDFIVHFVAVLMIFSVTFFFCWSFNWNDFANANTLGALLIIMMVYGLSMIPFSYLFSHFNTAAGGFAIFLILNIFLGVIPTIVVMVLQDSGTAHYEKIGNVINYICLVFFPQYGLTYVSVQFSTKAVLKYNWDIMSSLRRKQYCSFHTNPCCENEDSKECLVYLNYFYNEKNGICTPLVIMVVSGFLYLGVNIIWLYWQKIVEIICQFIKKNRKGNTSYDIENKKSSTEDDRVSFEAVDLSKSYKRNKPVVRDVSFKVQKGACFGLLGVNGAGKTTTFKMITKEIAKGGGHIYSRLQDNSEVDDDNENYTKEIGYCPQFCAMNYELTAEEMLKVFAFLRGFKTNEIDSVVNNCIKQCDLFEVRNKPCGVYSGGNKRKLSLALALMGAPRTVLLDEPTNGVDPISRRRFWTIIKNMQNDSNFTSSFVLTSHSMQECEALCNTIAIMKDGKIRCEGTIPELKQQYASGLTLKVKVRNPNNKTTEDQCLISTDAVDGPEFDSYDVVDAPGDAAQKEPKLSLEEVKETIEKDLNGTFKEDFQGMLHFEIRTGEDTSRLSKLFEKIEKLKNQCDLIEDYVISQTTIEDVFLKVANEKN